MNAVVVYESLWGNTAAIAHAVAEGIGPGARALATDEATPEVLSEADLVVAGAPVLGFSAPTEGMRANLAKSPGKAPVPPDLSHPSMRDWLEALPKGRGNAAAFETRLRFSPGGATGTINDGLRAAGYHTIDRGQRFFVKGAYGPLRDGELERARAWGAALARAGA
jgi:hypothetical protein